MKTDRGKRVKRQFPQEAEARKLGEGARAEQVGDVRAPPGVEAKEDPSAKGEAQIEVLREARGESLRMEGQERTTIADVLDVTI